MASFRKPPSKTRTALESSTALPPEAADVLTHVGEQAAKLTDPVKPGRLKAARKALPDDVAAMRAAPSGPSPALPDLAPVGGPANPADELLARDTVRWSHAEPAETGIAAAMPGAELAHSGAELAHSGAELAHSGAELVRSAAIEPAAPPVVDLGEPVAHDGVDANVDASVAPDDAAAPRPEQRPEPVAEVGDPATDIVLARSSPADASAILLEMQARLAEHMLGCVEDSVAYVVGISAVRSLPDALTFNSRHLERRWQAVSSQGRDLSMLAGKLALLPFAPMRI